MKRLTSYDHNTCYTHGTMYIEDWGHMEVWILALIVMRHIIFLAELYDVKKYTNMIKSRTFTQINTNKEIICALGTQL